PPLGFSGPSLMLITPIPVLQGVGATTVIPGEDAGSSRAQEARAAAAAVMPPPPLQNPVVVQPGAAETQGGASPQAVTQAPGKQMATITREEMQRIAAAAAAQAGRARGHPFSREILAAPLPNNFEETNLVYDGSSGPSRHVRTFENMVVLHGYSDSVCCRAFLSTLCGGALDWFHQLPPGSITDFEDFASKLTNQYSSAVVQEKTYLTLMAMRQGEKESLRKYVVRYNQTCLEVHLASDEVKAGGLIRSLRAGPCRTSLAKTPARSYEDVLKRCQKYINLEEMKVEFAKLEGVARPEPKKEKSPQRGRSPRRNSPKRSGPKRTSPRRGGRDSKQEKRDDRWQERPLLFERQRYHNFTPLRKDLTEVLEAMQQKMSSEDVTWPKTRFTSPIPPRSDIYFRFHRDYSHSTENCRHLKDEIERLIRAGHLKIFVYHERAKEKGRRRCRDDSEERSDRDDEGDDRDGQDGREKRSRGDGDKGGQGREAPLKRGTIYMISGGPTDGNSNNARKENARAVKRKREEVGITARMPVISFKAEDAEGVVLPHNDALVITAEVTGFDVKR
ncbi:Unknown protein, partial [Striga hermonthica]